MGHHAQVDAIGASNYKLIESGTVKWDDVVTPTRVRDLKEVVNEHRLTIRQMIDAGIRKDIAEHAYAASHTTKQEIVRAARAQALKNLEASGISRQQVGQHVAGVIGQRVGIAAGPSGPSAIELPAKLAAKAIVAPKLPPAVRVAMDHFAGRAIAAGPILKQVKPEVARTIKLEQASELLAAYDRYLGDPENPRLTLEEFIEKLQREKRRL